MENKYINTTIEGISWATNNIDINFRHKIMNRNSKYFYKNRIPLGLFHSNVVVEAALSSPFDPNLGAFTPLAWFL